LIREDYGDPFIGTDQDAGRYLVVGVDALGHGDEEWKQVVLRLIAEAGLPVETGENVLVPASSFRELLTVLLERRSYEFAIIAAHGYHDALDAGGTGLLVRRSTDLMLVRKVSVLGATADQDGVPYHFQDMPARELPPELTPTIPSDMITVRDLERIGHIQCPLVAVLGCQTGNPTLNAGDQPLNMAEVMLRIGAASVIAPMWDVKMRAVEKWMRSFLRTWKQDGQSRGEAARQASIARRDEGASLHDIGCLVLHGDWR